MQGKREAIERESSFQKEPAYDRESVSRTTVPGFSPAKFLCITSLLFAYSARGAPRSDEKRREC